jgi:hypothetical protein
LQTKAAAAASALIYPSSGSIAPRAETRAIGDQTYATMFITNDTSTKRYPILLIQTFRSQIKYALRTKNKRTGALMVALRKIQSSYIHYPSASFPLP